jgi:hypothetical protein
MGREALSSLEGEAKQAFIHVNRLAREQGLEEPEYRTDS